jgi:hypothetical protein
MAETSEEVASVAGRILGSANNELAAFEGDLRKEFGLPEEGPSAVIEKIGRILRPYFDDALTLAASVLAQREPHEDA